MKSAKPQSALAAPAGIKLDEAKLDESSYNNSGFDNDSVAIKSVAAKKPASVKEKSIADDGDGDYSQEEDEYSALNYDEDPVESLPKDD